MTDAKKIKKIQKAKDIPLSELTLRRYEKPVNLTERELVQRLLLSIGLLQPGDSRDVIVDIFLVLLKHPGIGPFEVREYVIEIRKTLKLSVIGTAASNIRRQIRRLKDLFLIEKIGNNYRINEGSTLMEIFEEKIEQFMLPSIIRRVKEYISEVDTIRHPRHSQRPDVPWKDDE